MTAIGHPVRASRPSPASRRVGYVVSIVVNAVALYVVVNLLAWGWLPFLTDEFARVLPLLRLSLLATIAVNVVYLWYDLPAFRSVMQIGLSAIAVAVALRVYDVYPFDFSRYGPAWDVATRVLLILAIVGTIIGVVVEVVRFARVGGGSCQRGAVTAASKAVSAARRGAPPQRRRRTACRRA
jgi:hypothetical protein